MLVESVKTSGMEGMLVDVSNPRGLKCLKCHSRVDQEYTKPKKNQKRKKIIQSGKTQKLLEICQKQRYTLQPKVSNPSGSVVSTMFCKAKSAKKKIINYAAIFDHIPTTMFNSETTSLQHFSQRIPNLKKLWTSDFGKWGQNRPQNIPHEKGHQTDTQTDRHTDISTTRSNRPSGPIQ